VCGKRKYRGRVRRGRRIRRVRRPKFKVDDVYDMVTGGSADVAEPKEHPEVKELIIEQRASAESVELLYPLHYTTAPAD
jgi:hypothetical protein